MHARFADAVPVGSPDSIDEIKTEPLEARIEQFKQNPINMAVLHEFIEEVVQQAETEACKQQKAINAANKSQQGKEKRPNFKNGKVVNRARGFVVRIFDAICNCANNNAAAATTRFKLRSTSAAKQSQSSSNGEPETLALNKKKPTAATEQKKKGKGVHIVEDVEAGVRLVDTVINM